MCTAASIAFVFLSFLLNVNRGHSASSNGQKAHFQVEDKSGDLKVIATKDMAKVTAQADSVQVVVKPGMADYPVVKSDKPIVHVANGCCGWNTIAFKKSLISQGKKTMKAKSVQLGSKLENRNRFVDKADARKHHSLASSKKRNNKKYTTLKNFKATSLFSKKATQNKNKLYHSHEKKLHPSIVIPQKGAVEKASKKSTLQSGEVGFAVTGTAGKLNMNVTTLETKVLSESGLLNVFLKRKANSSNGVAKHNVNGAHQNVLVHIAPELVSDNDIGLRKSNVPAKTNIK